MSRTRVRFFIFLLIPFVLSLLISYKTATTALVTADSAVIGPYTRSAEVGNVYSSLKVTIKTVPGGGTEFPLEIVSLFWPVDIWGQEGDGMKEFREPWSVTIAGHYVYVSDSGNHRIQAFEDDGQFMGSWGGYGTSGGKFDFPTGLAYNIINETFYVADTRNHRVQKLHGQGLAYYDEWGSRGSEDGQFEFPHDMAIGPDNTIYVVDADNHRIQLFDGDGNFLAKWGSHGTEPGQFRYPYGITFDSSGNIYVADFNNHRVQKFDNNRTFLTEWGKFGDNFGELRWPVGLAIDSKGDIYVADYGNRRIQKFSSNGRFLGLWETFSYPADVTVDKKGNIYAVIPDLNHIEKFMDVPVAALSDGESFTHYFIRSSDRVAILDVAELVPLGWDVTDISCSGGDPLVSGNSVRVTYDNSGPADIVCVFTNNQRGNIRVEKELIGTPPSYAWEYSGNLGDFTLPAEGGGSKQFSNLVPGTYTITEEPVANYNQAVSCSGGDSGSGGIVVVNLGIGENVNCIFTSTDTSPPRANFRASPTSGVPPLVVHFSNLSTGALDECVWDFGDGQTETTCGDPTHEFVGEGDYSVTLSVTGPYGEDSKSQTGLISVGYFHAFLPGVLGLK